MARLDLAPAVVGYLERHAIDVDLALELGVRSGPATRSCTRTRRRAASPTSAPAT